MLFNNNKNFDSKQRFGIRKLSVGVCSVLLSTLFLTMNSPEVVHASDSDKDIDPNVNEPEIVEVDSVKNSDDNAQKDSATNVSSENADSVSKSNESATGDQSTQNSDVKIKTDTSSAKTEIENTKSNNNQNTAPEGNQSSGVSNNAQTTVAAKDNTQTSTPSNDASQATEPVKPASPKADSDVKNDKTNDLIVGKDPKAIDPKLLGESKVNTKDTTLNWGNHRYLMDWDWQTHTNQYWNDRIKAEVMPWVLKENNNEGATFKSWVWTSQGTYDGDNWTPQIDPKQGFCYPAGNLVVENPNGTSTTTYTGITINIARSIASYFRCKYGMNDTENKEQTPVSDENSQKTYITVHANSENPFTQVIPNSSIDKIEVGGWTYVQQGDNAQASRNYFLSLIKEIKLTDANISQNGTTQAQFAITFRDDSVLQGKKATLNVVGGVAQTGLTVTKDSDFTFKYPNATSGITSGSQNNIAKWQPTYEWVDKDGNAISPSNPYNTSANFDAYVKINYKQDGKADGFQIVKVPVTISTTEHVNITISGNGSQTATYNGSAFNSSNIDPNNFKPSFTVTDGKAIPTPTAGNELTATDYDIHGDPTNVGSYDVYLNANGIAKVKKWNNSNLHIWPNETAVKVGTFTIDKAKPTVTFNGEGSKTYNGQPLSGSDYTKAIGLSYENVAGMGDQTISLTAGTDYVWKKGNTTYTTAPSDAGTYTIELTGAGKAKITGSNINSANLDWANATIKTDTSYVINQANATVILDGNNDSNKPTYNGSAVSMPVTDLQEAMKGTGLDFSKLEATDFDWYESTTATDAMKSAPINAGTYYIKLNSKGLSDLQAQNPNYKITQGTNLYTFTIKKARITINGNGDQNVYYDGTAFGRDASGDVTGLDLSKFVLKLFAGTEENPIPTPTIPANTFTASDFTIKNPNGTVNTSPTNVGLYRVWLNTDGIAKLQKLPGANNFIWPSKEFMIGSFSINQAAATVSLSGDDTANGPRYNGLPVSTPLDKLKNALSSKGIINGEKLDLTDLTVAGFDWYDANNKKLDSVPTDHGVYTIKLNENGLGQIQTKNPNYNISIDSPNAYTFKIKTARGSVAFSGSHEVVFGTTDSNFSKDYKVELTTNPATIKDFTPSFTLKDGDLEFSTDGNTWSTNVPTTVGTYKVKLTDKARDRIVDDNGLNGNVKWPATNFSGIGTYTVTPATTTATISSSEGRIYDGKITTSSDLNAVASITVPGTDAIKYTLVDGDYTWNTADHAAPINASDTAYTITLTNVGIQNLQKAINDKIGAGNVTIASADVTNNVSYKINKATATVIFTDDSGQTVDYTDHKFDASKFTPTISTNNGKTLSIPNGVSLSLAAGDFTINGTETTTEPTNVGTYTIGLSKAGFEKLQSATNNYNWVNSAKANYVISPSTIESATLFGGNDRGYNGLPVTTADINKGEKIAVSVYIPGLNKVVSYKLQDGDYTWNTPNNVAPINAGTYQLSFNLTGQGKTHLQDWLNKADIAGVGQNNQPNVLAPTKVTGTATFTVNQIALHITQKGSNYKDYDGKPAKVTIADLIDNNNLSAKGMIKGENFNIPSGLELSDFDWYQVKSGGSDSELNEAPTDAGSYYIKLNADGLNKLKEANKNYSITQFNGYYSGQYSFTINKATATVNFANGSGQTVDYTGQTGKFDASKFTPTISTNNGQTLSIPSGVNLSLAAGDFTINDVETTTEPTALGEYTIGLSKAGFEKLQSATNNYNWVNNAKATYVIRQNASSTVTLNGNQDVTYTGSAYRTDDIDVSKFTLTLPEGMKSYTLQKGDLEFVSGNPTTVSQYQVRLSKQGQENINKNDPNFSFDFTKDGVALGNATFTITKANPTVTFHGEGSKTFAQNDPNWTTNIGLAINAPGATNPTIALANDDYQFVLNSDNSVTSTTIPIKVGEYTIELTEQGKNKIKNAQGTDLNVANLDWSKANISGTGKFTVKVAEANAKLSGSNSRDYNGSAVTTTDINNGGNIVVSISIPGTDKTVSYTLQDGDYTWTNGTDPINQGSYTLELNKAKVLAHLQDQIDKDSAWKNNVTIAETALSGEATFTIKKVNASAQLQNGDTRKYNGSSTSISDVLSQLQNGTNWNASGFVNNEKFGTSTLTADGFDWYEADGTTKLTEDPKNVGNYVIKLNSKGISELQNANSNYTFTPNGQFTYEITKANGTVTFSGEHTITYGQSDSDYYKHYSLSFTTDPTISGFTPSYEIKAGDLQFSTDGQGWSKTVPTTKGNYQVRLDPSILATLPNAANIDWSQTGTGTYTINAATATAELSGKNNMTYSGNAATVNDVNGGTIGVTLNFPGATDTNKVFKLTDASYYSWNTADHTAPKDVGKYTITLTAAGKTAIQRYIDSIVGKGNVNLPSTSGSAEFDIDAKDITVTQGRSDQKTYNSQPASANINDVIAGISGSSTVANHPLNVPTTGENALTAADFDWWNGTTDLGKVSENNTAPTNAGSYSIKLNTDGLKKLQDANKNYSFSSVGNQYGYTINKATATISISGTQNSPWTGSSIAIDPTKFPATIKTNNGLNIPNNVTLEAGDYEYVDADGNAIAAPSELGQYKVRLTENGWKKLQSQTDNYTWSYDNSEGTVNINKATATVTLNGSGSVTYTGNTAQIPYDGSYTVTLSNGKTYTLQTGDLEFVDKSVGANTNVGTYQVKLSNEILTHLGAESSVDPIHYTYELAKNNTADLKVTPAEATATIAGNTSEAYKGSSYDVIHGTYNGNYSITWTIGGTSYVLQTGDYNYIDADGNVLDPTKWPVNVGIYKIGLTDQGKQAIEALTKVTGTDVNNYSWKFVNNATFTITAQKMALVVEGSVSKNYDGSAAVITQEDLDSGKVTVRWGNSANAPEGVRYTFTPDDFEVVTVDGQPAINSNDKNGDKYYIKLKDSVLNNIKDKNYEFSIGDTNAFYTIHTLSAALSVKGSQTVNYGSPEHLNLTGPNHFWIDFENWKGEGKPNITLQDGDLEIDLDGKPAYTDTNAGLPINVGTYTVKMSDDLINRLKRDYGDNYDFEAEAAQADGSVVVRGGEKKNTKDDVLTKGQDATHNDGVYIVQPLQIKVIIDGTQTVKYGSENYNNPSIINNDGQYSLKFDNIASRDKDKFDNFKLTSGDLEFVSTPGNVGQYQVKLTEAGINHLKAIDPDFATNYDWSVNVENARADFNVIQMPVTITVGNAQGTNGQSIVYGQLTTIDNSKYSISVKTEDGKTFEYNLQAGDLQFVTDPTNVGKYQVELSAAGLKKIKDKFGTTNYTYTSDGKGDFEVTAATANITLTGNKESTYDGKTPSLNASDYQLTGLPSGVDFKLQDGDLTFVDADGKPLATQPKDASETPYRVGLTQAAKDKLKADEVGKNYEWKLDQSKATYKINKATATVSFKDDQNSQTVNYDGKTDQFNPKKFGPTISTDSGIPTPNVPTDLNLSIADGDFEFTKDGVSQTTEPTGQGTYTVKLTAKGMQKIYGENTTNYDWTNSTVGTYTITAISISVSGQGNQDVTYDGTAFGNADKLDLNKFVPTLNAGTVKVPEIPAGTLTADDYTIKNSKGEPVTDPTNASEYTVWLNENGLNKLKKLSSNFTWPTDPIKVGTLNIAQTDVIAKLSGSNSKTYDGKAVSTQDINKAGGNITIQVTVNGKTYDYALKDGDYTWANGEAPTNVGEYTDDIKLDTTGTLISHLTKFINGQNKDLEGNFKIDAKKLNGSASFNIDQKNATVTQGGSDSKTYSGTAGSVTLDQLINNLTSNDLVSGQSLKTSGLTLNDFAWSGADPNHIAAGDYTISLTDAGLAKLQKDNPNYKLSVIGSFKYTINQATASAELSGSGEKTYNGDPVSDADIQKSDQNNNITVTVTIPGESTPQTVKLGVNDFTWPDDKVPSAAGTYTITLNANGEKAIKDKFAGNKNIDWTKTSFSGSATYTIKKADGKIDFTGSDSKDFDNKEVLPSDLDGNKFYVTINGQQIALPENGYEIVDANGNKVTPKDAGTYYVVLTADGLKELEKDTNYSWTPNWNGTTRPNQVGTFVINQLQADPTISGSNSKQYDGQPVTTVEVTKDGKIKVTVGTDSDKLTIPDYVLTDGDYEWHSADGNKISAPTVVGHYIIKLSTQGLQNIQAYLDKTYGKNNVSFDKNKNSGQADFDINPFEITVTINGSVTVDAGTTIIPDGKYSFDFVPTKNDAELPSHWTKPTIPVSDLGFDGQAPTASTTSGTFTVNYKGGQEALQKLLGDNYEVTYVAGKDNYIVKPSNPPTPDNPGQGSDDGGGTTPPAPKPQPTDAKPTKPSDHKPGDKPDHKPSKPGKPDKPNKPEKPNKPSKPNKPNKPSKPSKPAKPSKSKPSKPSKTETTKPGKHATKAPNRSHYTSAALAENGEKRTNTNTTPPNGSDVPKGFPAGTHWKDGMLVGPAGEIYYKNGHWTRVGEHVLPQTGAHTNMLATVFGSLASGLGILGLLGVHKKKKDEEEN